MRQRLVNGLTLNYDKHLRCRIVVDAPIRYYADKDAQKSLKDDCTR